MTTFTITVTPDDGTAANWVIEHFEYDGPDEPYANIRRINFNDQHNGTFKAQISLNARPYGFGVTLEGVGKSVEIDITPAPKLIYGGEGWPITPTGSPHQTKDLVIVVFDAGDLT